MASEKEGRLNAWAEQKGSRSARAFALANARANEAARAAAQTYSPRVARQSVNPRANPNRRAIVQKVQARRREQRQQANRQNLIFNRDFAKLNDAPF